MKTISIFIIMIVAKPLFAIDLAFLGCDPHADCMREKSAFGVKVRYEDTFCAQIRYACRTVECPKLKKDADGYIDQFRASQAAIQGELASIKVFLATNESSKASATGAKTNQEGVCTNLETFKVQTLADTAKKNEFVQALAQVSALDSSNQQNFLAQIDVLSINSEIKTHIKNLLTVSNKSSNDLKLLVDQYNHSNSTGIDELLTNSTVSCENAKAGLQNSIDSLIEQNKNLNERKRVLEDQYNDYERQIAEQEARKC